ncbi:MAG: hypothetical protein R2850_11010 [Bacteroidia bacterium]
MIAAFCSAFSCLKWRINTQLIVGHRQMGFGIQRNATWRNGLRSANRFLAKYFAFHGKPVFRFFYHLHVFSDAMSIFSVEIRVQIPQIGKITKKKNFGITLAEACGMHQIATIALV